MNNSWFWGMSSGCMALWDPWLWHDILLRASELPAEEHLLSTLRTHLMTIYAVRTCTVFCFSRKSFFFFKNFALSLCVSIKRQLPQTGWMDLEGCWGRRRWSGNSDECRASSSLSAFTVWLPYFLLVAKMLLNERVECEGESRSLELLFFCML